MKLIENHTTEFKAKLTDKIENEIVAFLNSKEGGDVYIGVSDDGEILGLEDIDKIQLQLSDRIKNNIKPATLGLFDVVVKTEKDKKYIHLIVSSGQEKPYYIAKNGMSPKGCYIRIGSGNQQMTEAMIEDLFSRRIRNSLSKIESPRAKLTFEQLQIYYQNKDLTLNEKFRENLDLLTKDENYNYIAYLLADDNGTSIKVAKYAGTTKVDLIENEEYGYCSLIKATKSVLDKFDIENRTSAKITSKERIERKLVDRVALREAVINAMVHNDYTYEVPPLFEIFSDRIVITSYGGLLNGLSEEDFFNCRSMPRNRELMRVFKDV
ncbi:MAG: putative DNA binding domain-containing protein, partial [Clostridia bacterium]